MATANPPPRHFEFRNFDPTVRFVPTATLYESAIAFVRDIEARLVDPWVNSDPIRSGAGIRDIFQWSHSVLRSFIREFKSFVIFLSHHQQFNALSRILSKIVGYIEVSHTQYRSHRAWIANFNQMTNGNADLISELSAERKAEEATFREVDARINGSFHGYMSLLAENAVVGLIINSLTRLHRSLVPRRERLEVPVKACIVPARSESVYCLICLETVAREDACALSPCGCELGCRKCVETYYEEHAQKPTCMVCRKRLRPPTPSPAPCKPCVRSGSGATRNNNTTRWRCPVCHTKPGHAGILSRNRHRHLHSNRHIRLSAAAAL